MPDESAATTPHGVAQIDQQFAHAFSEPDPNKPDTDPKEPDDPATPDGPFDPRRVAVE